MGPVDQQKESLADVAAMVLQSMSQNEDFPETPTLKKKFRCPYDGSTNVQKIRAILESAMHSFTRDGKTTPAASNSVLLNRYRPGKEPMRPYSHTHARDSCSLGRFHPGSASVHCLN